MGDDISSFVNEGLRHSSYLVDLDDGNAVVIDRHLAVLRGGYTAWSADHETTAAR